MEEKNYHKFHPHLEYTGPFFPAKDKEWAVSFSMYGPLPRYDIGLLANARLMQSIYPGWRMRLYHDRSCNTDLLKFVQKVYPYVDLIDMADPSPFLSTRCPGGF